MTGAYSGPLAGIRVLELGGIGPVQFAGMVLADLGADVVRLERPGTPDAGDLALTRGRTVVAVDLSPGSDLSAVHDLVCRADIAMEGFRPGVAERLGIGPDELGRINPRLVYGRMSGWGRSGPLADAPGHDINYIALSGALSSMRRPGGVPVVSPGFVGDFGGGGMSLAVGLLAATLHARASGSGQVVDCSITGGSAWISAALLDQLNISPETAALATGEAPFYNVYQCRDGGCIAVGALEAPFYGAFRKVLDLEADEWSNQFDVAAWPARVEEVARRFATRDRDAWAGDPLASEACITPVLTVVEAQQHEQNQRAGLFAHRAGGVQPDVAPRLGATPGGPARPSEVAALADVAERWSASPAVMSGAETA
jgi:alpha-methylacyl-CoA racemase